jgi:hypothetical protein
MFLIIKKKDMGLSNKLYLCREIVARVLCYGHVISLHVAIRRENSEKYPESLRRKHAPRLDKNLETFNDQENTILVMGYLFA